MLRWNGLDQVPPGFGPSAVTIGVFDGVHRGHQALVAETVRDAAATGATPVAVTFEPNPVAVLRPGAAPPTLMTLDRRLALLSELGVAAVLVLPFTEERAAQSAEDFVAEVVVGALRASTVIVGEGFRFGARARGDVALLRELGQRSGFRVDGVGLTGEGDTVWSSSWVRERVLAGEVDRAAQALGRPYRLEGTVVKGFQRGRTIGYPTANLESGLTVAIPADGVYAGWLGWRVDRLPAAISVGTNPTFDGEQVTVETYVLDRDDLELYDEHVAIEFLARLRDTQRFDGVEDLVAQVARDVDRARELTRP